MSHPRRLRPARPRTVPALAAGLALLLAVAPAGGAVGAEPSPTPVALAASPAASPAGRPRAKPASSVFSGPRDVRAVALTFDDGWDAGSCLTIAQELDALGVTATFFPNGMRVRKDKELWRLIGSAFPIGNHSMHHPDLTQGPASKVIKEIAVNERVIERITGRPMVPLLRPTFGARDARLARIAGELGYRKLVLWDTSGGDTGAKAADHGVSRAASRGDPGAIILLHCGPDVTPRIVPLVVARYACAGFRISTLEDLLAGRPGLVANVRCPAPAVPRKGSHATADPTLGDEQHLSWPIGGPWGPPPDGGQLRSDAAGSWRITMLRGPRTILVPDRIATDGWLSVHWGSVIGGIPGCLVAGGADLGHVRPLSPGCATGDGARLVAALHSGTVAHAVEPLFWVGDGAGRVVLAAVRPGPETPPAS